MLRELKRATPNVEYRTTTTKQGLVDELRSFSPQIILADYPMQRFSGMSALSVARENAPEVPFIFVSSTIGEEHAFRALREGASDVLKGNLRRLGAAVEQALKRASERKAHNEELRAFERECERAAGILGALPDVVWSADYESNQILYVSPAVKDVYGYPQAVFRERPELWIEAICAEDKPAVLSAWTRVLSKPFDLEYRIRRADGQLRWINDRGQLILDEAGTPVRIDRVARDVTEQAEQRQRMARLLRVRELAGSINAALIRVRKRDALFDEICRVVVSVGGLRGARIATVGTAPDALVWAASAGLQRPDGSLQASGPSAHSLMTRLVEIGAPAVWNDLRAEVSDAPGSLFAPDGALAVAAFPLRTEGRTTAFLALYAGEAGFFDDEEIDLFREVTSNLELALELIAKQEKLDYLALYDPLTGLPNRTLLRERLAQALDAERRENSKLALMVLDVERFTALNDAFGQHAGDRLLEQTAAAVRAAAGDLHYAAHLGGDVFAIMMPHLNDAADVATILRERANRILETPFQVEGRELRLQIKAGIAVFPDDGGDADTLFRNAEAALKKAKQTGERYLLYAPQINARVAERLELEHALRRAIERQEFVLHFQPKVELETRRIVGVEALVRWQRPGVGLVLPGALIGVLEDTGMIADLGPWVIEEALATYRDWRNRGLAAPRIAVNVSPLQLRQPEFVRHLQAAIAKIPPPCGLEIEVTESLLMQDMETATRKLGEVREMGVLVSLDDFGTGYSSLARLARLPVDALKIDRAFIKGMTDHPDDTSIVTTIITLGRTLHRTVIAEGVEMEDQARLLRLLRCEQIQGNVFSPAVPREQVEALLAAG